MRARNIKPGFYHDAELAECSIAARYLCPGLWMMADREGRLKDHPKQIKMEICPCDNVDIDALLEELAGARHLIRYTAADGQRLLQIRNFRMHQNPHRNEPPSRFPGIPESESSQPSRPKLVSIVQRIDHSGNVAACPEDSGNYPSTPADLLIPDSLNQSQKSSASTAPEAGTSASAALDAVSSDRVPLTAMESAPGNNPTELSSTAIAPETPITATATANPPQPQIHRESQPQPQSATANPPQTGSEPALAPALRTAIEQAGAGLPPENNGNGTGPRYITRRKRKLGGWKLEAFEVFWATFGLKKGRAEAADAWLDIPGLTPDMAKSRIIPAAQMEAQRRQRLIEQGRTPKWAQGWLAGRRWEDEAYGEPSTDPWEGFEPL